MKKEFTGYSMSVEQKGLTTIATIFENYDVEENGAWDCESRKLLTETATTTDALEYSNFIEQLKSEYNIENVMF